MFTKTQYILASRGIIDFLCFCCKVICFPSVNQIKLLINAEIQLTMANLSPKDTKWMVENYSKLSNQEIANKLGVSVRTVSNYGSELKLSKVPESVRSIKADLETLAKGDDTEIDVIVDTISASLRNLEEGHPVVFEFETKKEIHQFTVILSRWNSDEGEPDSMKILAGYSRAKKRVALIKVNSNTLI